MVIYLNKYATYVLARHLKWNVENTTWGARTIYFIGLYDDDYFYTCI